MKMASNLNIVYVNREFGPITGGGIGTYIFNISQAMAERGHNVYLMTDCFNKESLHLLPKRVELVETVPTRKLRQNCFFSVNHEYSYRVLDTLRKLTDRIHIDVVEFAEYGSEGFASIRAKRLLNEFHQTKLIVKLHTPQSLLYKINEDKQTNAEKVCEVSMEEYCIKHSDVVTSPSQSLADYFAERLGREDIRLCPYPMKLTELKESREFSSEQVKRVRFIGSVQVRKGVDIFIEAAKLVLEREPDFNFEIYGELYNATYFGKTYIDILQQNIPKKFYNKILFMGGISYDKIPKLFLESCFCVFPSRWENWANVCLEAMSMGCVVIASSNGGMSEMITHGQNGFLVNPLNPQEIANIILDYHKDYNFLKSMSHSAHYRSKQICDPDSTCSRIEKNYMLKIDQRNWYIPNEEESKVSVIIPYFNQPSYIQEAVDSVKASNYRNIEIVVVDDGSTISEAVQTFDKLDGVVKVSKSNGGLGSARNAGVAASSGQFILPLDADDKIHPDYIRIGVEALVNNPELSYVSCHAHNFSAFESSYIPVGYVPELMPFMNTDGKCTNLFRRSVFEGNVEYDEIMSSYEDWDFLLTLNEKGHEGDVIPKELFFYRRKYDSMVYTTANPQRAELIQYMMIKHQKAWEKYVPLMAIVLARLWKEAGIAYEHLTMNYLQVYFCHNNQYSEYRSMIFEYPQSEWVTLTFDLSSGLQEGNLRLDPSNKAGTILIKEIVIMDKITGAEIWKADSKNQFRGCKILGNDRYVLHQNFLVIWAATDDPQILVNSPVTDRPAKMKATLYYGEIVVGENQATKLNQFGLMKKISKIYRYAKAVISN
jgi:glycosyltransferase involved in cell wall biosynthesis